MSLGYRQPGVAAIAPEYMGMYLGGGSLGSNGKNCIFGGLIYNLEATNYNVSAQNNWWGQASGPLAGSVHETNPGFTIDTSSFLKKAPPACS